MTDMLNDVEILGVTCRDMAHLVAKVKRTCLYDCVTALDTTPGRECFWREREPTGLCVTLSDADFTDLPYADRSFDLGINDAPHLGGLGQNSYFRPRYGSYSAKDQRRIITAGARETWRVSAIAVLIKVTDHVNSARYKRQTEWVIEAIGQEPYAAVVVVHGAVGNARWSGWRPRPRVAIRTLGQLDIADLPTGLPGALRRGAGSSDGGPGQTSGGGAYGLTARSRSAASARRCQANRRQPEDTRSVPMTRTPSVSERNDTFRFSRCIRATPTLLELRIELVSGDASISKNRVMSEALDELTARAVEQGWGD
jgi:hypothetical protein